MEEVAKSLTFHKISIMKLVFALLYLLSLLPLPLLRALAKVLALPAYFLAGKRRRIGEVNLARCFPEKSTAERKRILRHHFAHMCIFILEYGVYWYSSAKRIRQQVSYQDKHHLDDAMAAGKKIIILYPHFCAFELAVFRLNQEIPLISIYSHQKNKAMDAQMLKGRNRYNNVFLLGRTDSLLSIVRAIKKSSAPFVYLPDQDFGVRNSVFAPFFGIPTATTDGLSRIAKLTGAVVIPAIPTRQNNGKVCLRFYPAWENFPTAEHIEDTTRMNAFIEERIRETPAQYFWLHKRFKTRPEGEPSFYD